MKSPTKDSYWQDRQRGLSSPNFQCELAKHLVDDGLPGVSWYGGRYTMMKMRSCSSAAGVLTRTVRVEEMGSRPGLFSADCDAFTRMMRLSLVRLAP